MRFGNLPRTIIVGLCLCTLVAGRLGAEEFEAIPAEGTFEFAAGANEERTPERFRLPAGRTPFQAKFERTSGPVQIFKVTFPSPVVTDIEENNTVHAHYFQPEGKGPFPGVIVLHILGGDFPLSQSIANSLARRGVAALFVKMPYYGERRRKDSPRRMVSRVPSETVVGMTQGVLDIRRAAGWLEQRPEVEDGNLGITGISLGGIMSALAGAAEPRFQRVAVMLGGGNLAQTLWDNPVPEAGDFRAGWEAAGGTRDTFIATLAPVDPSTYAHLLKGRKVLMVSARQDEIFSNASTLALWEAAGKEPELIWLEDAGHYTALKYIFRETQRLGEFFEGQP